MRRILIDFWSLVAALALGAAIVIRWRKGQVAMVPGAAAPAIRVLAVLIVFAQGCADKLRRKDEPVGQGSVPGAGQGGEPDGGEEQEEQGGEPPEDMSQGAGSNEPGEADMSFAAVEDAEFPLRDEAELSRCVRMLSDQGWQASGYKRFTRRLATVPEGTGPTDPAWAELLLLLDGVQEFGVAPAAAEVFQARWRAHLEARQHGRSESIEALEGLLLAAEALPLFDAWLAAYVWRRAAPLMAGGPARARLLARVEQHLRVRQALVKGQVEAGPIEFTAWRSKAAPPKDWRGGIAIPPELLAAARKAYASVDTGTWETAGTLALTVRSAGLELVRRGRATPLKVGQQITLRRLDLLHASRAATLRHEDLGDMSIGAGESAWAWDIEGRLGTDARARVKARVAAAQGGDADALKQLEAILPAAHQEIRAAVAARPDAPGSAGLRMLLALFDE